MKALRDAALVWIVSLGFLIQAAEPDLFQEKFAVPRDFSLEFTPGEPLDDQKLKAHFTKLLDDFGVPLPAGSSVSNQQRAWFEVTSTTEHLDLIREYLPKLSEARQTFTTLTTYEVSEEEAAKLSAHFSQNTGTNAIEYLKQLVASGEAKISTLSALTIHGEEPALLEQSSSSSSSKLRIIPDTAFRASITKLKIEHQSATTLVSLRESIPQILSIQASQEGLAKITTIQADLSEWSYLEAAGLELGKRTEVAEPDSPPLDETKATSALPNQLLIQHFYDVPEDMFGGIMGYDTVIDPFSKDDPSNPVYYEGEAPKHHWEERGVTFPKNAYARYSPTTGTLSIANTAENLDLIEAYLSDLRITHSQNLQSTLEVFEIPASEAQNFIHQYATVPFHEELRDKLYAADYPVTVLAVSGSSGNESHATGKNSSWKLLNIIEPCGLLSEITSEIVEVTEGFRTHVSMTLALAHSRPRLVAVYGSANSTPSSNLAKMAIASTKKELLLPPGKKTGVSERTPLD